MTRARCLHHFASSVPLEPSVLPRTSKSLMNPSRLRDPLTVLPGVGPATAREAARLGLAGLGDLLFHFPGRHEDFTSQRKIGELKWGEEATVAALLTQKPVLRRTRRRNLRLVTAVVRDETGYMKAVWFNQDYLAGTLKQGDGLLLRGVYDGKAGTLTVKSHEVLGKGEEGLHTLGLVPVYSTTEKIPVKRIRGWLAAVIPLAALLADPLPADLRADMGLPRRADAVIAMHFPGTQADFHAARRRMIFEELYLLQAGLLSHRHHFRSHRQSIPLKAAGARTKAFIGALPFSLTRDQKKACEEISADLASARPMQRLLQGDVGSGKTVVAVYAMLRAVESGRQAALMAPTEVLAEQLYMKTGEMLGAGVRTALLTSRLKKSEREELLGRIAAGEIDIVAGTHALIQKDVAFADLGVVVVDEQHRFGVNQREELAEKATRGGITPHVLHMTATPIPRTLALTLFGDLDLSVISQMPAGRRRIKTILVPEYKRAGAYGFIRDHLDEGRQCFVICPLIEESEVMQAKAVEAEAARLKQTEFARYRLALLHGQMPAADKQSVMRRFAAGEIQVLVSTTVVEVGIDVPNASVMLIEEAERFGLAQLHQLRGRVGRGRHESFCLLFADPRTEPAERRLAAMVETDDGFRLADLDLEIRGEGQLLGTRQSGLPDLKLARLIRDQELLIEARRRARLLIERDPALREPQHRLLREEIERMFGESVAWLERV